MSTHNIPSYYRKSKIYPYYAASPGALIYTNQLEHIYIVPKVFEPLKHYRIDTERRSSAEKYSKTSVARTLMARLPRLFRTRS